MSSIPKRGHPATADTHKHLIKQGSDRYSLSQIPQQGHTLPAGTPSSDPTVITKESNPKIRSAAAYKTNQTRTEPDAPYGAITSTSRDPRF